MIHRNKPKYAKNTEATLKYTLLEVRPHKFLLLAVLWETLLTLTLINIPAARQAFGIASIDLFEVTLVAGLCLITLLSIEITKRLLQTPKPKTSIISLSKEQGPVTILIDN